MNANFYGFRNGYLNEIPRKFEIIITRLGIGHTQISHSFLIAKEELPICTACGVQVIIRHTLTNYILITGQAPIFPNQYLKFYIIIFS